MAGGGDIEEGKVDESVSAPVEHRPRLRTVEEWNIALLRHDSPMPSKCCIFRVPEVLRRQDKLAYEPEIVSIGPFHRGGKEQFQLLEDVKKWYLTLVLIRLDISLESLIESVVKDLEIPARECYADTLDLDQNNFVEMLILDGCFLVELFRKAPYPNHQDEDDPIFNVPCTLEYLCHDLLLLENQLPWSVLEFFYHLIEKGTAPEKDLSVVVVDYFKRSVAYPNIFSYRKANSEDFSHPILHILDLIRTALVQDLEGPWTQTNVFNDDLPQSIPNAASLWEAGVTFKKGPGCILNIKFDKKAGVFTIPPLAIDERTGPMFRNLMAFEQCYHSCKHLITSYVVLMDQLIVTNKDMDFLCGEGIAYGLSAEVAFKFVNDLYQDTTVVNFQYKELCYDVHDYHNNPWNRQRKEFNRWRQKLNSDYFDTPWSAISLFAGVVLLVLTFLQTIYTIQSYSHPGPA